MLIVAVSFFVTACATTASPKSQVTGETGCVRVDANTTYLTTGMAYNPEGISAPVQSLTFAVLGDANCNRVLDANGNHTYITGMQASGTDVRKDLATAGVGVVQAVTNGALAAQIMSNGQCKGPGCGMQVVAISGSSAEAGAGADVSITGTAGRMCGAATCGSSPD